MQTLSIRVFLHQQPSKVYNMKELPELYKRRLFESLHCRTCFDKALLITLESCVQERNDQAKLYNRKSPCQPFTRLTQQHAVRQPMKRSPLCLTNPSRSANLSATCSHGGRTNANASCVLTTRPGGGRNCPHAPTMMLCQDCSVTDYNAHPCIRL